MAWSTGAVHDLTASGTVALAQPDAIAIAILDAGDHSGYSEGSPRTYWGIGHLTPGGTSGFLRPIPIRLTSQLEVFPPDLDLDLLGYTLQAGVAVRVTELHSTAVLEVSEPWDRNPSPVGAAEYAVVSGGGTPVQMWSYTVPSGKAMLLARLYGRVMRTSVSSNVNHPFVEITLNGTRRMQARLNANVVGASIADEAPRSGGPFATPRVQPDADPGRRRDITAGAVPPPLCPTCMPKIRASTLMQVGQRGGGYGTC